MTRPTLAKWIPWLPALLPALLPAIAAGVDGGAGAYDTIPGRPCLRSMEGMLDSMRDLARDRPDLVTVSTIGASYLKNHDGRPFGDYDVPAGGHDIYAVTVADGNSPRPSREKGRMLVTAGVHAREWAPPELLARFVEWLVRGHGVDADATWILRRTEVHAILYVNPDGRWMAERHPELRWRKNMNPNGECPHEGGYGTDINRNFAFAWGDRAGASADPCASDYHGRAPESEPEARAVADYARRLFPPGQRKEDPEAQMDVPFGDDNTGMYVDIHSSGGYVYYPWGHKDAKSPNDEALQALGRKVRYHNEYRLWAGSQPDFLYEASGDASDYMYAALGVASFGLEIGDDWEQECGGFEDEVVPANLPALVYAAKVAPRPFQEVKGPDVLGLQASYRGGTIRVSARASDGAMVNGAGGGLPDFRTGAQLLAEVAAYLDVHPDDAAPGDPHWAMRPAGRRRSGDPPRPIATGRSVDCASYEKRRKCDRAGAAGRKGTCKWNKRVGACVPVAKGSPGNGGSPGNSGSSIEFDLGDEIVELTIDASGIPPGRHTIFIQATDSDGYNGPVSSEFVIVPQRQRKSLRGRRPFDE